MLKIPPMFGFYVGNTRGGPLHLPVVFSCAFKAWYYLHVFYFVFACVKGLFCVSKLTFLLTCLFFTQDAKHPFDLRKIQVNACLNPPPFTPKHKPTSRVQCMLCLQANMEAIARIFLCIVPISQSHVSKWYWTTKSPNYAQQICKNVRQTCKKPYSFPLRITLAQQFFALPYASCRVQEGCQTLNPLAYKLQSKL